MIHVLSLTILGTIFSICHEDKKLLFDTSIVENGISTQTMDYHIGNNYLLFLNPFDTTYYFVQIDGPDPLPSRVGFVSYVSGSLVIRNLSDASLLTFSIGSNDVYGLGNYYGPKFDEELLENTTSGIVLVDDPPIDVLSCKCHPVAEVLNFVCEHGGEGATSCEVTDGGTIGPGSWTNHCSVSCDTGYFACCNE